MGADHEPDQEPQKYFFLREKIKEEPLNRKKMLYKISLLVGRGFLFGIAASIGFFALKPWAESIFRGNPDTIALPKEETEPEESSEPQTEPVKLEMTMDTYKELNAILMQTATEAKKCIVEVKGLNIDEASSGEIMDMAKKCSGVIAADNGQELLIVTNTSVLQNNGGLLVTFADGTKCSAVLKKKDGNIGLAVIGVSKSSLDNTVWERIKVASLGNSNLLSQGKVVIALGSPFGYSNGLGFGVVSSKERNLTFADGEYDMLVTDMPGTDRSSGVLMNVDGEVVGVLVPSGEQSGTLTAFGISSIKSEIEMMLNAKDVPYIGIVGQLVTKEISEERNIPEGIYVTEVRADSPAMKAGIQNGDIITDIGKTKIETVLGYHGIMMTQGIGEEVRFKGKRRGAEGYVEIEFVVTVGIKE